MRWVVGKSAAGRIVEVSELLFHFPQIPRGPPNLVQDRPELLGCQLHIGRQNRVRSLAPVGRAPRDVICSTRLRSTRTLTSLKQSIGLPAWCAPRAPSGAPSVSPPPEGSPTFDPRSRTPLSRLAIQARYALSLYLLAPLGLPTLELQIARRL